ncbi:LAMI_0E07932g1_1 [Lachancea mirantina]|uniref:Peptide-N(4)-(N-acetyl-beta-glucosaminyl)asparagine amidase n=1 Tax=Lachancea mirantina TaxID=1230905 RepID=A0A1G4JMX3_9SACH|nr:LAMI_0E07932g1_1 [Lachancea mirantina]
MTEQPDMKDIALRFLRQYKDRVVSRFRQNSDDHRFSQIINSNHFAGQICGLSQDLCLRYENDEWQSRVFEVIDVDLIYDNVDALGGDEMSYTDNLVKELLRYFKQDFFKWCNKPDCETCQSSEGQNNVGTEGPNPDESLFRCGVVEIYKCNNCGTTTRFPRYNDPVKLLETRTGRCGEWCNLFMLFLKSFGIESRYIWNREDHVWCEIYSNKLNRWVHVDSCEQSFDQPYIYSKNWNKKMSYVFALGKDGVSDVSKRYILQNDLPRDQMSEDDLDLVMKTLTKKLRSHLNDDQIYQLSCRDEREQLEWLDPKLSSTTQTSRVGRESGSVEWKKLRGEDGV